MKGATHPQSFDRIVRELFAPIYPVIARQIVTKTGLSAGHCLDAGCGTGALGRSLAQITQMNVTFFDQSDEMLTLACSHAETERLNHRCDYFQGDIHQIPLLNDRFDLVISRGSSPFWDDWSQAYSEIVRVLKPGGHGYIGGGFGTKELRDEILSKMDERNPNWRDPFKDRIKPERDALPGILDALNLASFEVIDDDSGFWVHLVKEGAA